MNRLKLPFLPVKYFVTEMSWGLGRNYRGTDTSRPTTFREECYLTKVALIILHIANLPSFREALLPLVCDVANNNGNLAFPSNLRAPGPCENEKWILSRLFAMSERHF